MLLSLDQMKPNLVSQASQVSRQLLATLEARPQLATGHAQFGCMTLPSWAYDGKTMRLEGSQLLAFGRSVYTTAFPTSQTRNVASLKAGDSFACFGTDNRGFKSLVTDNESRRVGVKLMQQQATITTNCNHSFQNRLWQPVASLESRFFASPAT